METEAGRLRETETDTGRLRGTETETGRLRETEMMEDRRKASLLVRQSSVGREPGLSE